MKIIAPGWIHRSLILFIFFFLLISLSACPFKDGKNEDLPETLRVAVLPDQDPGSLRDKFTPLLDRITREAEMAYVLSIPSSYEELLSWFHEEKVDLVLFGGYTFIRAHIADRARPVVLRDVDTRFRSYFLVGADHPARRFEDIKGETFAFGSPLSTSGHLMPRKFLQDKGIHPETFFGDIHYSGSHGLTALWVQEGKVTAGVANSEVVNQMFRNGKLNHKQVRIFSETTPYFDYVWAVRENFPVEGVKRIRDAFLDLTPGKPGDQQILEKSGARYYLPAQMENFQILKKIVSEIEEDE